MPSDHPNERAETTPPAVGRGRSAPGATATGDASRAGWIAWSLTAGLLAGLVAGVGGEAAFGLFQPPNRRPADFAKLDSYERSSVLSQIIREETPPTEAKNAALTYGLLGLALGGSLGLAGGLARRSPRAGVKAGLIGGMLGGATGAGAAWPMTYLFYHYLDPESGVALPLLIRSGILLPVGAAAGLAFGSGSGGRRSIIRGLLGGIAGAALGTMLFEVFNAAAFPLVRVTSPISGERLPRLLLIFCVTVFTSLGTAVGTQAAGRSRPLAPPA